jgi:multiple sugar transport system substrate-binding protein
MGTDAPLSDISEDKLVHFETAVRMVPQFDTENIKMISQGPSVCIFNKEDTQEVLASWLFTQYLLTNEVQIAYSQTEGYVPVTSKAQQSETYQDYLSREGEDTDLYYWAKLQASKLLLDNVDNTFVTPVFNGSASLRNAAGQLIEETRKAARQGKTIDDRYMEGLFAEMTALYRLDQTGTVGGAKQEQGPLPKMAIGLLAGLAVTWLGIGVYVLRETVCRKKTQKKIDF